MPAFFASAEERFELLAAYTATLENEGGHVRPQTPADVGCGARLHRRNGTEQRLESWVRPTRGGGRGVGEVDVFSSTPRPGWRTKRPPLVGNLPAKAASLIRQHSRTTRARPGAEWDTRLTARAEETRARP